MGGTALCITPTYFLNKSIVVYQPEKGFRFSIDSVLLAYFLKVKPEEKILEIGAGSGIVSFITLKRFPKTRIYALEIEQLFIRCLLKSIKENRMEDRLLVIRGDINRYPFRAECFDVIFANPPYFKLNAGRKSPYPVENLARKEMNFELEEFIKMVSRVLKNRGRFYLIFTAFRMAELMFLLKKYRLEPKLLRMVHSYPEDQARLILLCSVKNAREELRTLPPLCIYQYKKGPYSQEVENFLKGTY